MSALVPFSSDDFAVRTVAINGEPWFITADVLTALELNRSSVALLDDDERGVHTVDTPGGAQQVSVINEPGLYSLVLRSRKPDAKGFKRWITHDVIPAIRRTGSYSAAPAFAIPQTYAEALRFAADALEAKTHAEARAAELEPAARFVEHLVDAAGTFEVRIAAQILNNDPSISMGQNRLHSYLRSIGWVDRKGRVYQRHIDAGRLTEKAREWKNEKSGLSGVDHEMRITTKGLRDLHRMLGGTGPLVYAVQNSLPGWAS